GFRQAALVFRTSLAFSSLRAAFGGFPRLVPQPEPHFASPHHTSRHAGADVGPGAQVECRAMPIRRALARSFPALLLLLLLACSRGAPLPKGGPVAEWLAYGGDVGGSRHSPLAQITPENVGDLELAWVHHSGDIEPGGGKTHLPSSLQVTPI